MKIIDPCEQAIINIKSIVNDRDILLKLKPTKIIDPKGYSKILINNK